MKNLLLTPSGLRVGANVFPCSYGRNGFSKNKVEGDGKTPTGCHQVVGMLYRPDRIPKPRKWAIPIRPRDIWSDDVKDPNYNLMGKLPNEFHHEKLFRPDNLYDLIIITNWNWPYAVKGRGSAIFLHTWRRNGYPTEGCVALRKDHLLRIAQYLTFGSRLLIPEIMYDRKQ